MPNSPIPRPQHLVIFSGAGGPPADIECVEIFRDPPGPNIHGRPPFAAVATLSSSVTAYGRPGSSRRSYFLGQDAIVIPKDSGRARCTTP